MANSKKEFIYLAGGVAEAACEIAVPSLVQMCGEVRAVVETVRYLASTERALLKLVRPGDHRPVLVLPGFLCSDTATWALRRFLRRAGYCSHAWRQGINWGPNPELREALIKRLEYLAQCSNQKVTVVGWSLGGVYAREVASLRPDLIREVITMGTPLHGSPKSTSVWRAYAWINRKQLTGAEEMSLEFRSASVPCLSLYSKADGIVPWQLSVPKTTRAMAFREVHGSHIGLVANAEVMEILVHHLQKRQRWPSRLERRVSQARLPLAPPDKKQHLKAAA